MKILITGGTGLVGSAINKIKNNYNHEFLFMSSKDLKGISVLPDFIRYGIDSLKIEGRMKSHLYAGTTSKVYSEALSYFSKNGHFLSEDLYSWKEELNKVTHREYHEGNLVEKAGVDSIYSERETEEKEFVIVGLVLQVIHMM